MSGKLENALCDWLLAETKMMGNMRRLSEEKNVEVAQSVCATKEGYAWTSPCVGTKCMVKPPKCGESERLIANAHTHGHLKEETAFSASDYLYTLHKGMEAHCLITPDSIKCERVNWDIFKAKSEEERMRIMAPLAEADTLSDRMLEKHMKGKPYQSEQQQYEDKMYEFYKLASEAGLISKC